MGKTKELTTEMYSLAKAQDTVNSTNRSLKRTFAEASNGIGKYSKAWTMFSRILSGSPLWKLQNYVRSVGQAMDFYYSKTEEATKAANEQAQAMGQLTSNIEEVEAQLKLLQKAGNHKELIESNLEYKNTFNALNAVMEDEAKARELALARTRNAYDKTLKKMQENLKSEGKALQKALAEEKKIRDKADMAKYKKLAKDQKQARKLVEKLRKLESKGKVESSVVRTAEQEMRSARGRMGQFSKSVGGDMKEKLAATQGLGPKFDKIVKPMAPFLKVADKFFTFGIGGKLFKRTRKTLEDFSEFGFKEGLTKLGERMNLYFENLGEKFKGLPDKVKNMRTAIRNNGGFTKTIMKKVGPIFSIIGKVMKMALLYSMYFILFLVGALLAFVFIKKIFEKAEVMNVLMETLSGVFDGIKTMFGGAILIFEAFFGGGTLGERFTKLFKGIFGLYKGLYKIIFSVIIGAGKLLIKLTVAYIVFVIETYIKIFKTITSKEFWTVTVMNGIRKIGEFFSGLPDKIQTAIGVYWGKFTSWIQDNVIDAFDVFHTGGVSRGGMAMVGERGPELVKLPAGSRVHSNDTTKTMMGGHVTNNISVNVNGRLGASDSELRDIAKKIGRMVSTEINRTTSSSTNVRF